MTLLPHSARAGLMAALLLALITAASTNFNRILQLAEQRYGQPGLEMLSQWQLLLNDSSSLSEQQKLDRINHFFNQHIQWQTDQSIWQMDDYWATPLESMGISKGDCEDFTIAKYISLLALDVPINKLRITYVRAVIDQQPQAHMVLSYYASPDAEPLILDNVTPTILPASQRSDLTPVYSFNSDGLWLGGASQSSGRKPGVVLSRWRNLLFRLQTDGFDL
ncbi:transglutaminase-like cysteine peptidase [Oceanicoccus sagamiensis]|uniref:Transglutaminase n=1 Tax=Oceanicoccus sagamiensis TaxID=716816 RepID=A0A1X9NI41_9GAMM|nr:transglutaminase-like cysteine peptidase [Oceanicoccus sagamiensis]ARN75505.1 hypothetical protein BST96_16135 [Oceanicoccus sagamiensis]